MRRRLAFKRGDKAVLEIAHRTLQKKGPYMTDLGIAAIVIVLGGLTWGFLVLTDWLLGGGR
jgi:hypothetical protein